jgi:ketosteroid isomerase-like protein
MAADWFGSLGGEKVAVEFDDLQTVTGGDVAAAHAFITFKGLSAYDEELRAMNNRLTWVLRKTPQASGRSSMSMSSSCTHRAMTSSRP